MTSDVDLEQPFISHLIELRDRLIRIVLAVLIVFVGLFSAFGNDMYTLVAEPLMRNLPEGTSMIATAVASPFLTPMKLSLVAAIFITMPFLLYQFWAFIAPGLYQHERKMVMPLVISSTILFYLGALFAFYVVFPLVFAFLTSTAPEGVAVMTDMSQYLDFILTLFFAFGLAFEVPIAVIILIWTGATTRQKLAKGRPYVIVGAFVLGMLLTPPDVISQTLLALPMWVLFEFGLIFSGFFKARKKPEEDDNDYPDDYEAPSDEDMEAELDRLEEEDDYDEVEEDDADAQAIIDDVNASRLKRVNQLRASGEVEGARELLYEVLANGNDDQVMVARNILKQLDED